jgi:hypothetical protein
MKDRVGRNDSCPCGSGKKYKRCCLGATARERPLTSRHEPSRAEVDGDGLTLLVETAQGTMVRSIPGASPLRADARQGYAAEEATHNAAALWGMPDTTRT